MDYDNTPSEMVASLQSRKEALESKLREKTAELKSVCIQEAELTGVLPPETPLEPGESPPVFRRRVGTAFTYPENLINKLKSKEEESLATLELECKIQTGIAEAALGLANDGTASKCVRRKHRLVYQQSQRRLLELEARLNLLRQTNRGHQLKQRKKPRPPLESEGDCIDGVSLEGGVSLSPLSPSHNHSHGHLHQPLSHSISDRGPVMRHSHTYNGFSRSQDNAASLQYNHRSVAQSQMNVSNWQYHAHQHQQTLPDVDRLLRAGTTGHIDREQGYWMNEGMWYNTAPTPRYHGSSSQPEDERDRASRYRDRFGSLDRRRGGSSNVEGRELEPRQDSPIHRLYNPTHTPSPTTASVLLPSQTYPENSLMRTQSLGTVDHSVGRKSREKEWYETSLDTGPQSSSSVTVPPPPPPPPLPPPLSSPHSSNYVEEESASHVTNSVPTTTAQQLSFDTVVPFESPKNHTVVQAGKWQPYREVTKPFEMADFYKYSTKFRKNVANATTAVSPQHKGVYQPLQPMTCQPLSLQPTPVGGPVPPTGKEKLGPAGDSQSLADAFSNEMLAWYQDQNTTQPRSATLV